ncbi:MAG: tRNA (adenosine(37)-N6)-threonylcarbamoyltransferase complex dimerization subunit type 1 TsaB [Bacteroidota bacterium]
MNILLLETATEVCSVAIAQSGNILAQQNAPKDYQHSEQLTLLIQQVSQESSIALSELDAVVLSGGPGSYTALRVGSSAAKGICYAFDLPLIAVDTLESLARASAVDDENVIYIPMIDARRMEVYATIFDAYFQVLEDRQAIIIDENSFAEYIKQGKTIHLSGNGAPKLKATLTHPNFRYSPIVCDAVHLLPLAEIAYAQQAFEDVAYYSPVYGKAPNITVSKKKLL